MKNKKKLNFFLHLDVKQTLVECYNDPFPTIVRLVQESDIVLADLTRSILTAVLELFCKKRSEIALYCLGARLSARAI